MPTITANISTEADLIEVKVAAAQKNKSVREFAGDAVQAAAAKVNAGHRPRKGARR
jgi:hypothetical protein